MPASTPEQRYGPTSGTVSGWIGLLFSAAAVVALVLSSPDLVSVRWIIVLGAFGVLSWAMLLRPVIIVRAPDLVLRNPFSTWLVPLSAIDVVAVRAVTRVEAGGTTYEAVAVGRRVRKMVGRGQAGRFTDLGGSGGRLSVPPEPRSKRFDTSTPEALADLMTEQILAAAANARDRGETAGEVRRIWALPELVSLGVFLLALAVSLVL